MASDSAPPLGPIVFEHAGVWHAVQWPHRGRGATAHAALVDLALRRLLLAVRPAPDSEK